jgi:hypothetical protein
MSLLRKRSPIRLRAFWQIATLFGLTVYSAAVLPAQVDQTPPKSQILYPQGSGLLNEVNATSFTVRWSGTDSGSGIQDFTIYVQANCSMAFCDDLFHPWLTNTSATEAVFTGQEPAIYCFMSIARDRAGNIEPYDAKGGDCARIAHIPGAGGTSHVLPLPVIIPARPQDFNLRVTYSPGPSGVDPRSVTIYVSDNGASFTPVIELPLQATGSCGDPGSGSWCWQATFPGQPGHTYGFYSIAINQWGDYEFPKTGAEVTTRMAYPEDANADGVTNCADLYLVKSSFGKWFGQPGFDIRADIVSDMVVDVRDLAFVARKLPAGTRCP